MRGWVGKTNGTETDWARSPQDEGIISPHDEEKATSPLMGV